jgi:hypothetical protein
MICLRPKARTSYYSASLHPIPSSSLPLHLTLLLSTTHSLPSPIPNDSPSPPHRNQPTTSHYYRYVVRVHCTLSLTHYLPLHSPLLLPFYTRIPSYIHASPPTGAEAPPDYQETQSKEGQEPSGASGRSVTPGLAGRSVTSGLAGRSVTPGLAGRSVTSGLAGRSVTSGLAGRSVTPGLAGRSVTPGLAGRSVTPGLAGRSVTPGLAGRGFRIRMGHGSGSGTHSCMWAMAVDRGPILACGPWQWIGDPFLHAGYCSASEPILACGPWQCIQGAFRG